MCAHGLRVLKYIIKLLTQRHKKCQQHEARLKHDEHEREKRTGSVTYIVNSKWSTIYLVMTDKCILFCVSLL